ncbi:MAG TPA: hypothetical protein VNK70_02915 [Candidatus Paceibacterota bacterium]|nr:hypothetical protein [Candidatus Paceibacterota bacterium]
MQKYAIPLSIAFSILIVAGSFAYRSGLESASLEQGGVGGAWPQWGDIGKRLVEAGVIDAQKFEDLYADRGGLGKEEKKLLYGDDNGALVVNEDNAGVLLNLLWAFGIANKNPILEEGPMMDARYGGAGRFASTGGWTLARGNAMNHYSKHPIVILNKEQQDLVERVSKGIYRPCCNNSTNFPDCNHGMAMLGFLELMAAQGFSEEEMYRRALDLNSLWFPDTYATIAQYLAGEGLSLETADPREILSSNYSSASGYKRILAGIPPTEIRRGSGCGV